MPLLTLTLHKCRGSGAENLACSLGISCQTKRFMRGSKSLYVYITILEGSYIEPNWNYKSRFSKNIRLDEWSSETLSGNRLKWRDILIDL